MAVQDYKINYKSDFVLTINGDAGWAIPFCIKFWTGMPSQAYFVGFDGVKYVNCKVGDTPTQLLVMFDDHHLPIGKLKMQIAYHTTIAEFPGSVFDEVTNARDVIVTIDGTDYQVMLDFTGEDAPELEFDLPAYANEAERIQNELQRQQNEAARIEAELEREQASAAAVAGAENVNAQLSGNILTVTNRNGVSTSVNTKGEQGEQGPVGPQGPQGEQGVSIVDFSPKSQTATTLIYTATFSDGHTQDVAIPKGPKGDTGATGLTGPQGPQGDTGVSITGMVKTGETDTDTLYNITFSNGTTQAVAIPKGEKGDQGPIGPQGPQGPMGDVAVITPEQQAAFTMYSTTGQNTNGPMTQKAVTDALVTVSDSTFIYDKVDFVIVNGTSVNFWFNDSGWISGKYHSYVIPRDPSWKKMDVKSNSSALDARWAFLDNTYISPVGGSNASFISKGYAAGQGTVVNNIMIPDDCAYIAFAASVLSKTGIDFLPEYVNMYVRKDINDVNSKADSCLDALKIIKSENFSLTGNNATAAYRQVSLVPGKQYRLSIVSESFPTSNISSYTNIYGLAYTINNVVKWVFITYKGINVIPDTYTFRAIEADFYTIQIRADKNAVVNFRFEELDESYINEGAVGNELDYLRENIEAINDELITGIKRTTLPIPHVVQGSYVTGVGNDEGGVGDTTLTTVCATNSLSQLPYRGVKIRVYLPDNIGAWFKTLLGPTVKNSVSGLYVNGDIISCPATHNAYMIQFCYVFDRAETGADISPSDVNALIKSGDIKFVYEEKEGDVIRRTAAEDTYINAVMQVWYANSEGYLGRHNDDPVFVHISDLHGDGVRLRNALQWSEYKGVDAVINTGDNVYLSKQSGQGFVADIGSEFSVNQIQAIGNHDVKGDDTFRANSNTVMYNELIEPFESSYSMPSSSEYEDAPTYYYMDLSSVKTRIIVLNEYEQGSKNDWLNGRISQMQIDWFISTLLSTPSNYGVLLAYHTQVVNVNIDSEHSSFFETMFDPAPREPALDGITTQPITRIIDAFISRGSVSFTYTNLLINNTTETVTVSADFSSVNAGVEFIAHLFGHTHQDTVGYYATEQTQLALGMGPGGALFDYTGPTNLANTHDLPRDGKGINQDSFNVYCIDRRNKLVKIAKVGANMTIVLAKRDYMSIPYATT